MSCVMGKHCSWTTMTTIITFKNNWLWLAMACCRAILKASFCNRDFAQLKGDIHPEYIKSNCVSLANFWVDSIHLPSGSIRAASMSKIPIRIKPAWM